MPQYLSQLSVESKKIIFFACCIVLIDFSVMLYPFASSNLLDLKLISPTENQLIHSKGLAKIDKSPCTGRCTPYHQLYIITEGRLRLYQCPFNTVTQNCIPHLDSLDNKMVDFTYLTMPSSPNSTKEIRRLYSLNLDSQPLLTYQDSIAKIQEQQAKATFWLWATALLFPLFALFVYHYFKYTQRLQATRH